MWKSEVGTEGAAGGGERRAAASIGGLGVGVGEPGAVGAEDHDVAGGAEVGLQPGDGPAGGGVGEPEREVAVLPAGLTDTASPVSRTVTPPLVAVRVVGAVVGRSRGRLRSAGDGEAGPVQDVGHRALAADLGVRDVPTRGRERRGDLELPRARRSGGGGCARTCRGLGRPCGSG